MLLRLLTHNDFITLTVFFTAQVLWAAVQFRLWEDLRLRLQQVLCAEFQIARQKMDLIRALRLRALGEVALSRQILATWTHFTWARLSPEPFVIARSRQLRAHDDAYLQKCALRTYDPEPASTLLCAI